MAQPASPIGGATLTSVVQTSNCDCCGGSGSGSGSGECCDDAKLAFITITNATGDIALWFTETGHTFPFTEANPLFFSDVELCGGSIGAFSIAAYCNGTTVCMSLSATEILATDCVTVLEDQCISNCDECAPPFPIEGTGTVEVFNYVCDENGFVSVDFIFHTSQGDVYGTASM